MRRTITSADLSPRNELWQVLYELQQVYRRAGCYSEGNYKGNQAEYPWGVVHRLALDLQEIAIRGNNGIEFQSVHMGIPRVIPMTSDPDAMVLHRGNVVSPHLHGDRHQSRTVYAGEGR